MKPSDIQNIRPMGSATQKGECETVALNVAKILSRTGDAFRPLSWDEYKIEREKDGGRPDGERQFFDAVSRWLATEETAKLFSPNWDL